MADKICLMDKGKIVQLGTALDLLLKPKNEHVIQFLQNKQMTLLMKTITVNAIVPQLTKGQHHPDDIAMTTTTSIEKIMMTDLPLEAPISICENSAVVKNTSKQQILTAFYSYLKTIRA